MFSLLNENEHWTAIEGYEGLYAVSNMGRVYSHIGKGGILKNTKSVCRGGYLQVGLCKDGNKKTFRIHVLVGNAFVGKREGELTFDHIDRNPLNNCADNLRLASRSEQQANTGVSKNNKLGEKNIRINQHSYQVRIIRNKKFVFNKHFAKKDYTLEQVVEERNRFLDNYV